LKKIKICKEDKLFSDWVRWERDGGKCQRCGKVYERPSSGLQNSHYYTRSKKSVRFYPDNCDALCYGCHSYFEARKNAEYQDWKKERLGEERYQALVDRSNQVMKFDKAKEEFNEWHKG
jgi:5-methylcytosine-specific restriction endonuclease McrA